MLFVGFAEDFLNVFLQNILKGIILRFASFQIHSIFRKSDFQQEKKNR